MSSYSYCIAIDIARAIVQVAAIRHTYKKHGKQPPHTARQQPHWQPQRRGEFNETYGSLATLSLTSPSQGRGRAVSYS